MISLTASCQAYLESLSHILDSSVIVIDVFFEEVFSTNFGFTFLQSKFKAQVITQ